MRQELVPWDAALGLALGIAATIIALVWWRRPWRRGARRRRTRVHASAQLLDPDQVAGRIADGAVPNAPGLLGGLLDDVGVACLEPLERAVEVPRREIDAAVRALGHHLGDDPALVVGDAGVGGRRVQDDGRAGLAGRADRDPAQAVVVDVVPNLEAQGVPVERQGRVRVVVAR